MKKLSLFWIPLRPPLPLVDISWFWPKQWTHLPKFFSVLAIIFMCCFPLEYSRPCTNLMLKKLLSPKKCMKKKHLVKVQEQLHLTSELMKYGLRCAGKTVPQRWIWNLKCLTGIFLRSWYITCSQSQQAMGTSCYSPGGSVEENRGNLVWAHLCFLSEIPGMSCWLMFSALLKPPFRYLTFEHSP